MSSALTYSEKNDKPAFNWKKALSATVISSDLWEEYKEKARSWVTCACGNQCYIIPRDGTGCPKDKILMNLGGDNGFYGAVKSENVEEALYWLDLIEARAAKLIQEQVPQDRKSLRERVIQLDKDVRNSEKEITQRHREEKKALRESNRQKDIDLKKEIASFEKQFGQL